MTFRFPPFRPPPTAESLSCVFRDRYVGGIVVELELDELLDEELELLLDDELLLDELLDELDELLDELLDDEVVVVVVPGPTVTDQSDVMSFAQK